MVLQQYSNDTPMVLQQYSNGTPMVLQRYSNTSMVLQWYSNFFLEYRKYRFSPLEMEPISNDDVENPHH